MENKDSLITSIIINNNDTNKDNTIQYTFLNTNGSFEFGIKPEEADVFKMQREHIENLQKINTELKESLKLANIESEVNSNFKKRYNELLEEFTRITKIDDNRNINENDNNSVNKELKILDERESSLRNEIDNLKKEIISKDKLLSSEKYGNDILKSKISKLENLYKETNIQADEYLTQIAKLKEDNNYLIKEKQETLKKLDGLKEENNNLFKEKQEMIKKFEEEKKTNYNKITDLNLKNDGSTEKINNYEQRLKNLENQNNELNEKNREKDNEIENLHSEKNSLIEKIKEKDNEIENLQLEKLNSNEIIRDKEDEIEKLTAEKTNLDEGINDFKKILEEKQQEINRLSDYNDKMPNRMNSEEYERKIRLDEMNNFTKLSDNDETQEIFSLTSNIVKILNKFYNLTEIFLNFCKDGNININGFNSLKFNLSQEYSQNLPSFRGYIESLMTPYNKIEETISKIAENIDMDLYSEYLIEKEKYFRCINCSKLRRPQEIKRIECNCHICTNHTFTKFDLNFHKKKAHI